MKYLGIDYGLKKIGLALSEGMIASPLTTLNTSSLSDALSKVQEIMTKEGIETVAIGLPDSGSSRQITEAFIAEFKKNSLVKIIGVSETLSTQTAKRNLQQLGVSRKKRQQDDSMAAALILQDYLDSI
ncbi:hypothetical protein A2631_04460 [Candidatus Daviesbacteria bacterium RIFCSPHIGHO2_01_FULL_44_29]|uniref:Putative pre-16S rRNA nuclease n=1 Tax=Candidatus Daviesbacteria bacterium RIFCSPHIGHO2_02_FULL_43_12 TaxID=1797776 RepID=A0A1F5KGQ1_9BACT|nr:MAG: hypothetical protein A2631_04460 [Candidatus Daviesbacteria bacterium RIFCSPHIGHO2_01_FULL_44_29]OGE39633.1 MAG: hypothetical protein A3E86_03450 [Candidatus Daviesbacteria bacterium RIFCSPHIGHO2_12_FULL_47_45]OGE39975.1 MAG: hypothetical protein A3D25_04190 [Candidatus Daviesbacteria bacterium RIFCSPHIGHO2_02_FULL_43_12]OGE70344.1 MAG: hypothetical protein A3B55_01380 [Candidatus Daviesbacteria bacterium RIFCSPLOWO2_01_FULL_43_15]